MFHFIQQSKVEYKMAFQIRLKSRCSDPYYPALLNLRSFISIQNLFVMTKLVPVKLFFFCYTVYTSFPPQPKRSLTMADFGADKETKHKLV